MRSEEVADPFMVYGSTRRTLPTAKKLFDVGDLVVPFGQEDRVLEITGMYIGPLPVDNEYQWYIRFDKQTGNNQTYFRLHKKKDILSDILPEELFIL